MERWDGTHCHYLQSLEKNQSRRDVDNHEESTPAARQRVRSEYESYPATLSNILASSSHVATSSSGRNVIHVIGASDEAELTRGPTEKNDTPEALVRDYADALVELAERYGISDIELYFIGPDCIAFQMEQPLQTFDNKQLGTLHVTAIHGLHHEQAKALSTPDSVIICQSGFTVPNYDWSDSLKCIRDCTPFLLTSNTVSTPAFGTHFRLQLAAAEQDES